MSVLHPHLLALIVATVQAIENRILLEDSHHKLNEIVSYWDVIVDSISEGIITFNSQGIITGVNEVAAKAFQRHPQ